MTTKAEHLTLRALSDILDGYDAIPALGAAQAQLMIEAGELPPGELNGYPCDCDEDDCPFAEDGDA